MTTIKREKRIAEGTITFLFVYNRFVIFVVTTTFGAKRKKISNIIITSRVNRSNVTYSRKS